MKEGEILRGAHLHVFSVIDVANLALAGRGATLVVEIEAIAFSPFRDFPFDVDAAVRVCTALLLEASKASVAYNLLEPGSAARLGIRADDGARRGWTGGGSG